MAQEPLTATQLYKTSGDTVSFAEWMEAKNKVYALYQQKGGKKTFVEWEKNNQNPSFLQKNSKIITLLVIAGIIVLIINQSKK